MKRTFLMAGVAFLALTGAAASLTVDGLIGDLQAAGYTRIEVKQGPTQVKIEAIKGSEKVETIYDMATGTVLKRETDVVDAGDNTAPGITIRDRRDDFIDAVRGDDDDGVDDDNGDDDDRDDDKDDDRDDDRDDDHDDDNGGDDDHDGDDNGGHGRGGDGGGDDNGGDDD